MYDNEIWKDIPGYEGLYQVSDMGRVRSLDRAVAQKKTGKKNSGKVNRRIGCILKQTPPHKGYVSVILSKDGKRKRCEVHYLVARTFLGPIPSKHHTHHQDGDSLNNCLKNLVYLSASYHGHITHRGENAHKARLTEIQVREVREMLAKGYTQKRIAQQYGVARSTIGEIKRGASWEWLTWSS